MNRWERVLHCSELHLHGDQEQIELLPPPNVFGNASHSCSFWQAFVIPCLNPLCGPSSGQTCATLAAKSQRNAEVVGRTKCPEVKDLCVFWRIPWQLLEGLLAHNVWYFQYSPWVKHKIILVVGKKGRDSVWREFPLMQVRH